jgi:hypothetical protein
MAVAALAAALAAVILSCSGMTQAGTRQSLLDKAANDSAIALEYENLASNLMQIDPQKYALSAAVDRLEAAIYWHKANSASYVADQRSDEGSEGISKEL